MEIIYLKNLIKNFVPVFQKFPDVDIKINSIVNRRQILDNDSGMKFCIFSNNDDITGEVSISIKEESKFEHIGISIELIGKISIYAFLAIFSINIISEKDEIHKILI